MTALKLTVYVCDITYVAREFSSEISCGNRRHMHIHSHIRNLSKLPGRSQEGPSGDIPRGPALALVFDEVDTAEHEALQQNSVRGGF
jgi:hypothetical protein